MILALLLLAQVNTNVARPASGSDGLFGVEGARGLTEPDSAVELQLGVDGQLLPVRTGARIERRAIGWAQLAGRLDDVTSFFALLPAVLGQDGDVARGGFGVADIRLGVRRSVLRGPLDLGVQLALETPTSKDGALSGDDRLGVEALVAMGARRKRWGGDLEWLGNALVRFRPPRDLGGAHPGTMAGLRGGAAWSPARHEAFRRAFVELELGASFRDLSQRTLPLEWRAGATLCLGEAFALEGTLGTRLDDGLGSPSGRLAVTLRYAKPLCTRAEEKPRETDADILAALAREREAQERAAAEARQLELLEQAEKDARARALEQEMLDLLAGSEADAYARAAALAAEDTRDSDGDGVPDRIDNCPHEKGPASNQGCPLRKRQLVVLREGRIDILEKVFFATGKARIEKRSYRLLDQVAQVLAAHPDLLEIEVQGHTDDRGRAAKNTALSQARAEAVVAYLRRKGVAEDRLSAQGIGPARPIAPNTSAAGREKNRRVEFHVLKRRELLRVIELEAPQR